MELTGKTVVVTGGGRGLGRAITLGLSRAGMNTAIIGRTEETLQETKAIVSAEGNAECVAMTGDISSPETVAAFGRTVREAYGSVDVLINNAAGWLTGMLMDAPTDEIHETIDTTVKAPIWLCREFWPDLKKAKPGYVVNITTLGVLPGRSNATPIYIAAKAGLSGFTESLRRLGAKENVLVTEVLPGSVASEFSLDAADEDVAAKYGQERIGPADVVESIVFALERSSAGMVEEIRIPAVGDWFVDWATYP